MVNISVGGSLLRTKVDCQPGAQLKLVFDLPHAKKLTIRGLVVRSERRQGARESLVGIRFTHASAAVQEALRRFVQSQVNFREFFGWLKKSYFEGPDASPARPESGGRTRDIFGLDG
jgi:hypothetical protein